MTKLNLLAAAAVSILVSSAASAATYTFVGSWFVDDGPMWSSVGVPVMNGQEAAALIFGGSASDYVISTVSNQVADINFSAWMDGWGDGVTYGTSGNPAPHDFASLDSDGLYGTYDPGETYSAYVSDHGLHLENFAFTVAAVPVPAGLPLLLAGLGGFAVVRRRKA